MSKKQATASTAAGPRPVLAGAALGVFAIIAVIWFWQNGKSATAPTPASSPTAPLSSQTAAAPAFLGTHYPSQGHRHFAPGESTAFKYNTNPPTSGPHEEVFSPQFINPAPLSALIQAHLLEHGNILLQYHCECPDVAASLSAIAFEYDSSLIAPNELQPTTQEVQSAEEAGKAVIVAPNDTMPERIAITAWTRLGTLQTVDKPKIESFIAAYLTNEANASQ